MPVPGDGRSGTFSATVTQFGGYKRAATPSAPTAVGRTQIVDQPSSLDVTVTPDLASSSPAALTPRVAFPMSTLADTFATADTAKWSFNNSSVTSGQLVLTPAAVYNSNAVSTATYSLAGSAISAELVQHANFGSGTTESYIALQTDYNSGDWLIIDVSNNLLYALYRINDVQSVAASITYSATDHRWLRIGEASGTVYWQYSPDGDSWTTFATWAHTFPVTSMVVTLGSGFYGTEPTPGTVVWDNVNTPTTVHPPLVTPSDWTGSDPWTGTDPWSYPYAWPPTVGTTITSTPGLASSTAQVFAPSVSTASGPVTVTPGLASSTAQVFAPTISTAITVTPGLASSSATALAPTVSATITVVPGLASSTASALAPAVSTAITVTPGLASSTASALTPAVTTTVTVTPGLASSSPAVFAPVVTVQGGPVSVVPDLVSGSPQVFAPAVTTAITAQPGVVSSAPQVFAPAVAAVVTVSPGVASSAPTAHAPAVSTVVVVVPGLASSAALVFTPTVSAPPPSATRDIAVTFGPGRSRGIAAAATGRSLAAVARARDVRSAPRSRQLVGVGASRDLIAIPEE